MSKLKELFSDLREFNRKYKCLPLTIFTIIYIASPIDLLPELFFRHWLFYLDDMAVLILTCIITYMEVFLNERSPNNNEYVEGLYSAVRRNPVGLGSRWGSDSGSGTGGDAVHGLPDNQLPQPGLVAATELVAATGPATEPERVSGECEQFTFGPVIDGQPDNTGEFSFYERQIIESASATDDCVRQASEQSRPESFVIDNGNAIIW